MDFLDPKLKKAHSRRLFIGYILMAIAISMGTLVLLFAAYGYDVDRKTGEVIQNGTIYLDSEPSNALVYVGDEKQSSDTSTRLALPGGKTYTISLKKDGYIDWKRTLSLDGGSIERLEYAWMVPKTIKQSELQLYSSNPTQVSQSLDQKKLLVLQNGQNYVFDLYNLEKPSVTPAVVSVPESILSNPKKSGTLNIVEWTKDSKYALARMDYEGTKEFVLIDIQEASRSVNLTKKFNLTVDNISFVDGKASEVYLHELATGSLKKADISSGAVSTLVASGVISYQSNGQDTVVYATQEGTPQGSVSFRIRRDDKTSYLIRNIAQGENYLIKVAEYEDAEYVAIGTNKSNSVFVFKDPYERLKDSKNNTLLSLAVLRGVNAKSLAFSPEDHRHISVQSDKGMVVYDIEGDRQFSFLPAEGASLSWVDDYRFIYVSSGSLYVVDFDGSNNNKLVSMGSSVLAYFSPDYKKLFSLSPSLKVEGRTALTMSNMTN